MARIVVTGGAGFIVSQVADEFIRQKHKVVIIDNLSTGFEKNINPRAKFYKVDINSSVIDKIFKREKLDILCHHAAQIDIRKSVENPILDAEGNILGSLNLFESCIKHKVKKVIFASTGGAIYGEQAYFPADESHPAKPLSPYGIAKLSIESYLHFYAEAYGLNYISLRYANVYGPRQNSWGEAGVVAIFARKMLNGEKAFINGDGKQTRDFVYVNDVVKANLLALGYPKNNTFNIGTGIETDINTIFKLIKKETENNQKELHLPAKKGEQVRSVLDFSKARKNLKWRPKMELTEGIKKTVEYFKDERC
ncbi:MAG: NAD-dependent epimerase/dehydratase family protein [candidate division Zixibacteria bacterium]|nr:NAD-dependent epimerase/dehydratase family protein [candidate division Zixibacteria bacterium]